ncbi:MAG: DUF3489 domain-containing protein [Magnetococcales bacterium]|nr:DUF3489 domain-containing protein [Magnetococcales bacterium]
MATIKQKLINALTDAGEKIVKKTDKYTVMTRSKAPGLFWYIGDSGALRTGRTVTDSTSWTGPARDNLLKALAKQADTEPANTEPHDVPEETAPAHEERAPLTAFGKKLLEFSVPIVETMANDSTDTALIETLDRLAAVRNQSMMEHESANTVPHDASEEEPQLEWTTEMTSLPMEEVAIKQPRKGSKGAQIIDMMATPEGATLESIAAVTGWSPNTIRGFLSIAQKKYGLNISKERNRYVGPNQQGSPGSWTVYRIS